MGRPDPNQDKLDGLPTLIRKARDDAHLHASDHPEVCLMICISAAELLLRDLSAWKGLPIEQTELQPDGVRSRKLTGFEMLQELRKKGLLPKRIVSSLHGLRVAGNSAKHEYAGDAKSAATALVKLDTVLEWYSFRIRAEQATRRAHPSDLELAADRLAAPAAQGASLPSPDSSEFDNTLSPEELFSHADALMKGKDVPQDSMAGVRFLLRAAAKGHAQAQAQLGACYATGVGLVQDDRQAFRWSMAAAEQGVTEAQHYVANVLAVSDIAQAAMWFRAAAEKGHPKAQFRIGQCCLTGQGVSEDPAQAVRWLRKAADQSDGDAAVLLGDCLAKGVGVQKDADGAFACYRRAAGLLHPKGIERVKQCRMAARRIRRGWIWLAAILGTIGGGTIGGSVGSELLSSVVHWGGAIVLVGGTILISWMLYQEEPEGKGCGVAAVIGLLLVAAWLKVIPWIGPEMVAGALAGAVIGATLMAVIAAALAAGMMSLPNSLKK